MFSFFKADPIKKLDKKYSDLLEQAMQAQRNGNIMLYAQLTEQAEAVRDEIECLKAR